MKRIDGHGKHQASARAHFSQGKRLPHLLSQRVGDAQAPLASFQTPLS